MKKIISLLLAVAMMLSLVACGGNGSNDANLIETDLSNPVTIKWIMPGPGIQADSEMVWAKFNEELHKVEGFENVTVDIEVIPVADYAQKMILMQTSGEQMDIIQTYQLQYADEYRDGTIIDMTPYLEKYAKETLNEVPQWVIDMGKVDGGQAILPNYQKMVQSYMYVNIPEELAQYADIEGLEKAFMEEDKANNYILSDKSKQLITEYLSKVSAAGKLGKGYVTPFSLRGVEPIINIFQYYYNDPDFTVVNAHLDAQQQGNWKFKKEMYDLGYVRKDALSAKNTDADGIPNGNAMFPAQNIPGVFTTYLEEGIFDVPVVQIPAQNNHFVPYKPAAGGTAIPVNSQYPDVAAKIINLMNSSKGIELFNIMVYGIEGVHYTVEKEYENGDKLISPEYADEGNSSSKYGLWKWIVGNAKNAYLTVGQGEDYKETIYTNLNEGENTIPSPLMGFALDADSIEVKLTQIKSVSSEYGNPIGSGAADTEKLLAEMEEKYKLAGSDEIIAEIQAQVDAFVKTK
ncbi:MAG: ABC transporter substrate-binding protein [Clostridia bacterium]|nr:ABC transporter substrate-binding protein [Clostridia bacterium]